jgi:hypothetical protein
MVQKELKKHGKIRSLDQIKQFLEILSRASFSPQGDSKDFLH